MVAEEVRTGLAVAATVLVERPFHFQTTVPDVTNGEIQFLCPQQIAVGAPVKLITEDRLWLGTVRECRPEKDEWMATLQVEHTLRGLPELLSLAARFE